MTQGNITRCILVNYMFDIDWLVTACPLLKSIPTVDIIHGTVDANVFLSFYLSFANSCSVDTIVGERRESRVRLQVCVNGYV